MPAEPTVRIGAPMWANARWAGWLFPKNAKPFEKLESYARYFHCVEGNTTFYALPKEEVVSSWNLATPDSFRFCFKIPKSVTHGKGSFQSKRAELFDFFERMDVLGPKLGPFFFQFPPKFSDLDLALKLAALVPAEFQVALELRHSSFQNGKRQAFIEGCRKLEANIVHFETRPFFNSASAPKWLEMVERKPSCSVDPVATGMQPFVRYLGDPDFEEDVALLKWPKQLEKWVKEDRSPYFFLHHVDDDAWVPHMRDMVMNNLHSFSRLESWPANQLPPRQLELF